MVRVVLHGSLADDVGRAEWSLRVSSPVEALRAIEANTGKVVSHFTTNLETEYRVVVDGSDLSHADEFSLIPRPCQEIHIVPVLRGSGKGGGWLAFIGIAILAVMLIPFTGGASGSLYAAMSTGANATALTGLAATTIVGIGISLTFAGISQMLTPSVKTDDNERPENKPSYIFNGAVNTYQQGNPVPVGFGLVRVGSQVISAGVRATDIDVDATPLVA